MKPNALKPKEGSVLEHVHGDIWYVTIWCRNERAARVGKKMAYNPENDVYIGSCDH